MTPVVTGTAGAPGRAAPAHAKPCACRTRREVPMSTNTLILIVVLVLLFGGGGFFWSRRG